MATHMEELGGRTMQPEDRASAGGFVLVSGCLCLDPAVMANVSVQEVRNQTTQVLKQMEAILMQAGTALTQKSEQKAAEAAAAAMAEPVAVGQTVERQPHFGQGDTSQGLGEEDLFKCNIRGCGKAYKNRDNLQKHAARVHNRTAKVYACNQPKVTGEVCDFHTQDAGKMSNHKRYSLAHNRREDFKFACPACRSRFPRRHEFDRHVRACKAAAEIPANITLLLPSSGPIGDILLSSQVTMATPRGSVGDTHLGIHGTPLMLSGHSNQLVDSNQMAVSLEVVDQERRQLESTSHERL